MLKRASPGKYVFLFKSAYDDENKNCKTDHNKSGNSFFVRFRKFEFKDESRRNTIKSNLINYGHGHTEKGFKTENKGEDKCCGGYGKTVISFSSSVFGFLAVCFINVKICKTDYCAKKISSAGNIEKSAGKAETIADCKGKNTETYKVKGSQSGFRKLFPLRYVSLWKQLFRQTYR